MANGEPSALIQGDANTHDTIRHETFRVGSGESAPGLVALAGDSIIDAGTTSASLLHGGKEFVLRGGIAVATQIRHDGKQNVSAGGLASGTVIHGGGEQDVYGTAIGSVVHGGGLEVVMRGGVASGTRIDAGATQIVAAAGTVSNTIDYGRLAVNGTASGTHIERGGLQVVYNGGEASDSVITGGTLEVARGGMLAGSVTFAGSGGTLQIDDTTVPANTILGFGPGDTLDLRSVPIRADGTISFDLLNPYTPNDNVLHVTEQGRTYSFQLDPASNNSADTLLLFGDGHGGAEIRDLADPFGGIVISGSQYETLYLGFRDTVIGGQNSTLLATSENVIEGGDHDIIDLSRVEALRGLAPDIPGATIEDVGTPIHDTVIGFAEAADYLAFAGQDATSEAEVIASAKLVNGNTVLSYPDHSTITLVGVTHVDGGIFA